MDRLLFDTNVLLDILERRAPWFPEAVECLELARSGRCQGAMTALSLSDIAYIQRSCPRDKLYRTFARLRSILDVAPFGAATVDAALAQALDDLEDGFQFQAAAAWGASHVLTRNGGDFPQNSNPLPLAPAAYLSAR